MLLVNRLILIFLIQLFTACNVGLVFQDSPKTENGILNLTFWDFEKQGAINLEGDWDIYWKKIYRPDKLNPPNFESPPKHFQFPGLWNDKLFDNEIATGDGYATFKLKILLPENSQSKQKLALRMKEQATAYELYLDEELISSLGQIGISPKESIPGYGTKTVFFESEKKTIELTLIVSNFHHRNGGIWNVPILGNQTQIQYLKYERNSLEFLLGGSILIMTIYHFMLFLFRKNDFTSLYFALFCLLALMRVASTGEIMLVQLIPGFPYELVTKFEYFSFFLLSPLFVQFFKELFPNDISNKFVSITLTIGGVLGMIVFFSNLRIYNYFVNFNYMVIVITALIVIYYQIKIILKKREDSITIFAFTCILICFIANDILNSLKIIQSAEFLQIGVFIFLLAQSIILSRRFSKAFRDIEMLSSDLTITNNAYSNFVPKDFLILLLKSKSTELELGNLVNKELTILFSGIRGFTAINENIKSEEIFNLLNNYYTGVTSIIRSNHGFIEKFIGDGIIVLFPNSPENAIKASRDMIAYLENFNQNQIKNGKIKITIGIGIHTGNVTLGTLGGKNRMDTTVIGNAIGITKKLETLTKSFFIPVIISSTTYSSLPIALKEECREIDNVKQRGNSGPLTIYEFFGGDIQSTKDIKKKIATDFFRALTFYRGGFLQKAKDLFSACQSLLPEDSISSIYINRCNDSLLGDSNADAVKADINIKKPLLALIVDSNLSFLSEIELILKREKFDILKAHNAAEAISACENMKPEILFVSITLDDMSGLELIKILRKDLSLSKEDCYIIAMSNKNNKVEKSLIYESGADDFILKPFSIVEIKQILERVIF